MLLSTHKGDAMRKQAAVLGLACVLLVGIGASCTSTQATKSRELTVVGQGTVPFPTTPRVLVIGLHLNGTGTSVKQTTDLASIVFSAVISGIEGAGASATDISRQGQQVGFENFPTPSASDEVRVKISSDDQATTYLDAIASTLRPGFRQCRVLRVQCDNVVSDTKIDTVTGATSALLTAARMAALADAKARATALARAAGVTLGAIQSVVEGGNPQTPQSQSPQAGFSYTLTVTYALR